MCPVDYWHLFPTTVLQRYACWFSTFHSWEDYSVERLTHLPKITQQVRPGGLDQSPCSQPLQLGGLPTSPFCFSSQSYWVYIFKDTLKISTSKPVFLHGSLMPVLQQPCPWGHTWIYNPEKKISVGAIMMQNFSSKLLIKGDEIFKTINLRQSHSILFVQKW